MINCIKHNFRLVNNRYDDKGRHVIEGGTWVTEKVCNKCGEVFEDDVAIIRERINSKL